MSTLMRLLLLHGLMLYAVVVNMMHGVGGCLFVILLVFVVYRRCVVEQHAFE